LGEELTEMTGTTAARCTKMTTLCRAVTLIWAAVSGLQFTIWLVMCLVSGGLAPAMWWLWTAIGGGLVVSALWLTTQRARGKRPE
jgi:hypothetical protein